MNNYTRHSNPQYRLLCIVICLFFLIPIRSQIVINELMQSNIDCVLDDQNEFPDSWVELYNAGANAVTLMAYRIGIKANFSKAYVLPTITIPSKGYRVIYCDKKASSLHTNFVLESTTASSLYLFDASGNSVDQVTLIPAMLAPNVAYGRVSDGLVNWKFLVTPTPNQTNNSSSVASAVLPDPVFSISGRTLTATISLSITKPTNAPVNSVVRYTLDSSEPTTSSPILESGSTIVVSNTTIVKAKLFAPDAASPLAVTHSYIFHKRRVSLPVISISTNRQYLYDSKLGIYVIGNYSSTTSNFQFDWRRPLTIEYFPASGTQAVLNQRGEMRVSGGASRQAAQKSLILYSNKRFGQKYFNYDFWADKPANMPIKSILLRNSGNDFLYSGFRDAVMQMICFKGGMDLDWQAYQPAILYLNGSYNGIINIRERSTEDYVYANYNQLEDIDMFENLWDCKAGDWGNLNAFKSFYANNGNSYAAFEQWMDVNEFMNVNLLNVYFENRDYPGNNNLMWRPRVAGGKWRWIVKDTDFGLGLYNFSAEYDFLNFMTRTDPYEQNWANSADATQLFRQLMSNDTFKNKFIDKLAVAMGDYLSGEAGGAMIDSVKNMLAFEYPYHREQYASYNTWVNWTEEVNNMKSFMYTRTAYLYDTHLRNFFNLGVSVPTTVNLSLKNSQSLVVYFNNNLLSKGKFNGKFYQGREIKLKASSKLSNRIVAGWLLTTTVDNQETTDTVPSDSLNYLIPVGCTSISIEAILGETTAINPLTQLNPNVQLMLFKGFLLGENLPLNSTLVISDVSGRILFHVSNLENTCRIPFDLKGVFIATLSTDQYHKSFKLIAN